MKDVKEEVGTTACKGLSRTVKCPRQRHKNGSENKEDHS